MFLILGFIPLAILYYFKAHNIIKEAVVSRYHKFRDVNKLVSTKYKNTSLILYISCNMICKMYWMNFLQWCNNSLEILQNKNVSVSYILNGKKYCLVVKNKKGPCPVFLVLDENYKDITDEIIPYLGPNYDWHNSSFCPSFWNKKKMIFEISSGEQKIFNENENINLN